MNFLFALKRIENNWSSCEIVKMWLDGILRNKFNNWIETKTWIATKKQKLSLQFFGFQTIACFACCC